MRILRFVPLGLAVACAPPRAQRITPSEFATPPALQSITAAALRSDLYYLASDSMRGREGGTADELRASAWLAERARAAGLEPAGDDGTYFQFFPMRRTRVAPSTAVAIGDAELQRPADYVLLNAAEGRYEGPILWIGRGTESDLAGTDIRGKIVAAELSAPENTAPLGPELSARRYTMLSVRQRAAYLTQRGAAAILLVSDTVADPEFTNIGYGWNLGGTTAGDQPLDTAALRRAPVIWLRRAAMSRVRAPNARLRASLTAESFIIPSVNVVGRVRGTDRTLRDEHVLFSAHQDGLGTRYVWNGDSIWRGADDNASTSVAILAAARAFARNPARRSALFVWHGSEEIGLQGSRWYAAHPTVPFGSIVAVLNGDMIGRGAPNTAALLGSQPPNRTSADLIAMALDANTRVSRFAIDSSWDRPTHPERFFTRSDHYPYAQRGVPVAYFTTMLHPDYHTPRDDRQSIDYPKLERMARWIYATGWAAANRTEKPKRD